jgi:hypothetical protein
MSVLFWTAVFAISPPRHFYPRSDSNRQNGSLDIEVSQCTASNFAEETGLEPAHQFPDTGFQDRGDTNYALLFHYICTGRRNRTYPPRFWRPGRHLACDPYVVTLRRFELPTVALEGLCSILLSYKASRADIRIRTETLNLEGSCANR